MNASRESLIVCVCVCVCNPPGCRLKHGLSGKKKQQTKSFAGERAVGLNACQAPGVAKNEGEGCFSSDRAPLSMITSVRLPVIV